MRALILVLAVAGCVEKPEPGPNHPPTITYARASCYWDAYYRDYIWWFEAGVTDPNGVYDVAEVYADVWDVTGLGEAYLVDSFALYPTWDPAIWFSDWLERSTRLYCGYQGYEVDLWAYDTFGETDVRTVKPY